MDDLTFLGKPNNSLKFYCKLLNTHNITDMDELKHTELLIPFWVRDDDKQIVGKPIIGHEYK